MNNNVTVSSHLNTISITKGYNLMLRKKKNILKHQTGAKKQRFFMLDKNI